MKLGILASGNLGFQVLKELYTKYEVIFIGTDSSSKAIIEFAKKEKILLFKGNPRNGAAFKVLKSSSIDVLASINYLFLIEEDLINLPNKIAVNIHGSLLPKYRGRTPHVWAIINGEKHSGITVHEITLGCDEGRIINQLVIPIDDLITGGELLELYFTAYPKLLIDSLELLSKDNYQLMEQNESKATYFGKRTPDDGHINWNWSRERISNWVRAQSAPYPGAFSYLLNEKIIIDKVKFSDYGFSYLQENGTILSVDPLIIKSATGAIELLKLREKYSIEMNQILN